MREGLICCWWTIRKSGHCLQNTMLCNGQCLFWLSCTVIKSYWLDCLNCEICMWVVIARS